MSVYISVVGCNGVKTLKCILFTNFALWIETFCKFDCVQVLKLQWLYLYKGKSLFFFRLFVGVF